MSFRIWVAALLRGMGYYPPFVAPKGRGVDIIGYDDPLGTLSPRIKVQVKHRQSTPATVQEVRQLIGLLQKDGDVGLFVSTYGFSPDAKATARNSHVHVELIDLQRLVSLWQEFYPKLTDEDKNRLPLLPIFFLAPSGMRTTTVLFLRKFFLKMLSRQTIQELDSIPISEACMIVTSPTACPPASLEGPPCVSG